MKKKNQTFTLGSIGCGVMAAVFAAIAIIKLTTDNFPLGYAVEAFTKDKIGITVLFLAAAADLCSILLTQIVYRDHSKLGLISKGTMVTGMAYIALIFVFQQSIVPIILWVLGAAVSVVTLSACSEIVNPKKEEKK